jgi:HSP20 family molecular chaperone IbpA
MDEFERAFERFESQMERLLQDILTRQRWLLRHGNAWRPPTDVYETDEAVVVRVEIAGLRPEDVMVALHDRWLVISGYRHDPTPRSLIISWRSIMGSSTWRSTCPGRWTPTRPRPCIGMVSSS